MKKIINTLTITAFLVLALASIVSAAGVASVYTRDNPLYLQPGESKDVQFNLQNLVGDATNMTLRAQVVNGTDLAVLTDSSKDYLVPFGTKDVMVNLRVTAPQTAQVGDQYDIGVSFTSVSEGAKGQFAFGSAFEQHFSVIVPAPPVNNASSSSDNMMNIIYLVIGIVIVAGVILYVRKRNKN